MLTEKAEWFGRRRFHASPSSNPNTWPYVWMVWDLSAGLHGGIPASILHTGGMEPCGGLADELEVRFNRHLSAHLSPTGGY
jgi:hypothetical protein